MGKLVPQLPEVVTLAYILRFRRIVDHWKGIFDKYKLFNQNMTSSIV
jgi:hypothetical protein